MKKVCFIALLGLSLFASPTFAAEGATQCSGAVRDAVDIEFGAGSADATRCIGRRANVNVVFQVNQLCKNGACTAAYALGNIKNAIKDYEQTHGMERGIDYKIVAIVHSAGWPLVLNDSRNPFHQDMVDLLDMGVEVRFCQNTARKKGLTLGELIPGVQFVTAGVTALADYQLAGYAVVQP